MDEQTLVRIYMDCATLAQELARARLPRLSGKANHCAQLLLELTTEMTRPRGVEAAEAYLAGDRGRSVPDSYKCPDFVEVQ